VARQAFKKATCATHQRPISVFNKWIYRCDRQAEIFRCQNRFHFALSDREGNWRCFAVASNGHRDRHSGSNTCGAVNRIVCLCTVNDHRVKREYITGLHVVRMNRVLITVGIKIGDWLCFLIRYLLIAIKSILFVGVKRSKPVQPLVDDYLPHQTQC